MENVKRLYVPFLIYITLISYIIILRVVKTGGVFIQNKCIMHVLWHNNNRIVNHILTWLN